MASDGPRDAPGVDHRALDVADALAVSEEMDLDAVMRLIKRDTRHYARRQLTWFRAEPLLRWLDVSAAGGAGVVADRICEAQRAKSS